MCLSLSPSYWNLLKHTEISIKPFIHFKLAYGMEFYLQTYRLIFIVENKILITPFNNHQKGWFINYTWMCNTALMFAENITSTKPNQHINMITTPKFIHAMPQVLFKYISCYTYVWQIRRSVWNTQKLYFNLNEYIPNKTVI